MGSQISVRQLVAAALVAITVSLSSGIAQEETSIWQCLPEQTVAALRIPNGQAVLDALRETRFGATMFSEERKAALIKVCEKHGDDKWTEYLKLLEEYDLTHEELFGLLAGETGYSVALTQDSNEESLFLGLGWVQPGEELAGKFFEIIGRAIEEQDSEQAITRVDLELAGQEVMQLRLPHIDLQTEDFELPDDYDDLSEEQQEEAYERDSTVATISYRTALICRLDDRLLIAHQFASPSEGEAEFADEQLSALLASLLTAHASGGSEGFAPRLSDDPSVARTMSGEGAPVFELLADFQALIKAAQSAAEDVEEAEKVMRMAGLQDVGPLAMRQTVEGADWRTLLSQSLPAPRSGLMRLLDQEMLEIDPPQWVPASAVRYFQLSFDLGKAYETIKEEVTRAFPESTAQGFAMAETQVQNFAQVTLPELLSSLGNSHTIMTFGVQSVDLEDASDDDLDNNMNDRMAIVWQLTDEQVWSKFLKVIAPFAGMAPGTETAEEQGFSGYRMKNGQMEGGLFLGKGYLVLGVGEGVVEKTLSALNNPPSGSNALRGSELYSTATDLIDMEPAMYAEITDNDRYLRMVMDQVNQQFDQLEAMFNAIDDDEDGKGLFIFDFMRAVMPKEDELPGLLGVSVSRMEINDEGAFMESVQELPGK